MFDDAGYPHPVPSFVQPVDVPGTPPELEPLVCLSFNAHWLPYVIGALKQLALPSTWDTSDQTANDTVVQQAQDLIYLFTKAGSCVTPELPFVGCNGEDGCMANCGCFRQVGTQLQMFCCGEWTTIFDAGPGTPSAGQPQAAPNGGTQSICLELDASSTVSLGMNVSSGDQLVLSDLLGTWRDTGNILGVVNCPDGYAYVEGLCLVQFPQGSPDPVPTALHMGIIAYIDGTAYDVLQLDVLGNPQVFTVPGGIDNKPVFFQANIATLGNANGHVSFCVQKTNNQASAFTHEFDFTISPLGWVPANNGSGPLAVWTPGTGWTQVTGVSTPASTENGAQITFPARHIDSVEVFYSASDTFGIFAAREVLYQTTGSPVTYGALNTGAGTFDTTITNPIDGVTVLRFQVDRDQLPHMTSTVTKVIVKGTGTDPF